MNREETKKAIEVMQAYVDGKDILNYSEDTLNEKNGDCPSWDWDFRSLGLASYSVKLEPIERWMTISPEGQVRCTYLDPPETMMQGDRLVHMREVIE